MYVVNRPRPTRLVYWAFEQSRSTLLVLRCLNLYVVKCTINFRPVLLDAPLQLGALSVRLVRLCVNPALP